MKVKIEQSNLIKMEVPSREFSLASSRSNIRTLARSMGKYTIYRRNGAISSIYWRNYHRYLPPRMQG